MEGLNPLEAVTPIDGRYRETIEEASKYFSEHALMKYRLKVEKAFLAKLLKEAEKGTTERLPKDWERRLEKIVEGFSIDSAQRVKEIERRVGHDVVALIRYLKNTLREMGLEDLARFVHLGLTSEDVNNLAYSMMIRDFMEEVYLPSLLKLVEELSRLAEEHVETVILGRTHGQPAIPTTFGRMIAGYVYRAARMFSGLKSFRYPGKFGGAIGDHAALTLLYPDVDWIEFSKELVESLGLEYWPAPTQVLPHDKLSELLSKLSTLCSILSNLSKDLWILGALGLIRFTRMEGEIHSSTMPQKANPILLENAEGCLDLAAELFSYLSRRLIYSRLHRDLSDSPIKRFYGAALALLLQGTRSLLKGIKRVEVNVEAMRREVEEHWEVLAEAAQASLRREGIDEPRWREIQDWLKRTEMNPLQYTGLAARITKYLLKRAKEFIGLSEWG